MTFQTIIHHTNLYYIDISSPMTLMEFTKIKTKCYDEMKYKLYLCYNL